MAYAVTYLVGTGFIVWFLPNMGPKLMGVNLKEEARKLQAKISGSGAEEAETLQPSRPWRFAPTGSQARICSTRPWPNWRRAPGKTRVFISRIRRDGKIIEPEPDTVIREGDIIAVLTRSELLMARGTEIGPK